MISHIVLWIEKLEKLQQELDGMRLKSVKPAEVQSLAKRLGRKIVNRGKHPMWESEAFGHLFALSIPDHGGKDLSPQVKKSVLNQLQGDIDAWDERLPPKQDRKWS